MVKEADISIVFDIRYLPQDTRANLEALEMILAAAALEIETAVVFRVDPAAWLQGQDGMRWRQLIDFGLAQLWTTVRDTQVTSDYPIPLASAEQIAQFCSNAEAILVL